MQLYRANLNRIAVDESGNRLEPTFSDERAVLAFKILDGRVVAGDADPCMTSGDIWRIEEQLEIRVAASTYSPSVRPTRPPVHTSLKRASFWGSMFGLATGSQDGSRNA